MSIGPGHFMADAIPLVMVFFVFYAVVIRPGRVSERRRWTAVAAMQGGERVELASGLLGTFIARHGSEYEIALDSGFQVRALETSILRILPATAPAEPPGTAMPAA